MLLCIFFLGGEAIRSFAFAMILGGKGSWSWIIGMDSSCNFDEQKRYIDFSAAMGWRSVLVDALWDKQIGYEKMEELSRYAQSKGVSLMLWYNSNGSSCFPERHRSTLPSE